jgi:Ran GTPase-activating protein (RanGAP) involved in mRNA processing and transport
MIKKYKLAQAVKCFLVGVLMIGFSGAWSMEEEETSLSNPIENLPKELLVHTLSFLPPKDLYSSRKVCKGWEEATPSALMDLRKRDELEATLPFKDLATLPLKDPSNLLQTHFYFKGWESWKKLKITSPSPGRIQERSGSLPILKSLLECTKELISLDISRFKLGKTGIPLLKEALKDHKSITSLNLSYNELGPDSIEDVAQIVAQHPKLLAFSDEKHNMLRGDMGKLTESLGSCRSISYLNLKGTKFGNEGLALLKKALKGISSLKLLNLSDTCLTKESSPAIASLVKRNPQLTELALSDNDFSSIGAENLKEALQHCPQLTTLELGNTALEDGGVTSISQGLINHPSLRSLFLSANELTHRGATFLGDALATCPNLQVLDVNHNHLGDKGIRSLTQKVLEGKPTFHTFKASHNEIGAEGIKDLGDAVRDCTSLENLYLAENPIGLEEEQKLGEILFWMRKTPKYPNWKKIS